jgi:hypothetical protein
MAHSYTHGPSMSDHFVLPTTICWKVGPTKHAKSHNLQSHPMWWVLFTSSKHNPLARTHKPEVNILLHESWHTEKYPSVEQMSNFP